MENNIIREIQNQVSKKEKYDIATIEAMKETIAFLAEDKAKNGVRSLTNDVTNLNVMAQRIIQNAKQGGILNKDFYLVKFSTQLTEIKTAKFLISLATKYSINPISFVRYDIVFEGDKLELTPFGYQIERNNLDDTNYNYVEYGICEVVYKDGNRQQIRISKKELDKLKNTSNVKNNDSSVWSKWPIRMCENKLLKKAFKAIAIDNKKMLENGYSMVEDEVALKTVKVGDQEIIAIDNKKDNDSDIGFELEIYHEMDHVLQKKELKGIARKNAKLREELEKKGQTIGELDEIEIKAYLDAYR